MLKFNEYNKYEDRIKPQLRFYSFDWDDNILFMPTVIHMERLENGEWIPEDVSTEKFAKVRKDSNYRIINNDPEEAFSEFKDNGPRGKDAFLNDTILAISKGKYGPSWDDFIESLTNGSIFSIITARGHNPEPMRESVRWIIDNILTQDQKDEMAANLTGYLQSFEGEDVLSNAKSFDDLVDYYLSFCDFYGVSSPWFEKNIYAGSASDPEDAKKRALTLFAKKIEKFGKQLDADVHLGFSDDDPGNVKAVQQLFKDEPSLSEYLNYYIYDTGGNNKDRTNESVLTFESFDDTKNVINEGVNDSAKEDLKKQFYDLEALSRLDQWDIVNVLEELRREFNS